ncbi:MAG: DUF1207 domain-containing protein [Desulfobacterales bacterium]|nr:MAG: DUF1207 domain-containing protein [Desulfobacterales bacterium]
MRDSYPKSSSSPAVIAALIMLIFIFGRPTGAAQVSDEFIRGYATAVLGRDFQNMSVFFNVRRGVVYLSAPEISEVARERIRTTLSQIEGVQRVEIVDPAELPAEGPRTEPPGKEAVEPEVPAFLPRGLLFTPLLADPRWPHFSASYQNYSDNDQLQNVGSANFGETFSIYRFAGPWDSLWEVGIQAGVFSIFDLDAASKDLINADYFVGIPLTFEKGNFANMTRIFHQSSHLGDEFILRGRARERINLSYESVHNILSYDLPLGLRIYGGGGYLFDQEPSDLKAWSTQAGLEFRSPVTWWEGSFRSVAAVDIQNRQESDWDTEWSLRAGLQFENQEVLSRKLQILCEYYHGKSPNGQFYEQTIEYFGLGLHFFYD